MIEEVADPEKQCDTCPRWKKIGKYDWEFRAFMTMMIELYYRAQAGWRIRNNDLSLEEWGVLARIRQYYEMERDSALSSLSLRR